MDAAKEQVMLTFPLPATAAGERASEVLARVNDRDSPLCAEIGVFAGDMSMLLLAARQDLFLVMVDPYETLMATDTYKATDDFHATMTEEQHKRARHLATLRTEFANWRVNRLLKPSIEAADMLQKVSFDLVFIDGDHSYAACASDIAAWWPLVKMNGFLGGHDYRNDKKFGVMQAVDEFVKTEQLDLELGMNYCWFVRKPEEKQLIVA